MDDPYETPHSDAQSGSGDIIPKLRSNILKWRLISIFFGILGFVIGMPPVVRSWKTLDSYDLAEMKAATAAMYSVIPWLIAVLIVAAFSMRSMHKTKRRLRKIQNAEQASDGDA